MFHGVDELLRQPAVSDDHEADHAPEEGDERVDLEPGQRARLRIVNAGSDPTKRYDPGNPDICPVFDLHKIFTPSAAREACATASRPPA